MPGYTKLVPEIVDSSIWNEPSDIRVVWLTMLAIKDADGYVRGNDQTLARRANVSLESCREALKRFQEPDPSSHTPDNEGKRIKTVSGGWIILNNDLYREIGMNEANKEYWRNQKRLQRQKGNVSDTVQDMSKTLPDSSASASASASASPGGCKGGNGDSPEHLALEAHQAFPHPPNHASAVVMANVYDLLQAGHTPSRLRLVFKWAKQPGEYKPGSPISLTDPGKFQGWLKKAMEPAPSSGPNI